MASTITELKQKSSYTHDKFGNEYKIPLDQMSEEQLEKLLANMKSMENDLFQLKQTMGWK